MSRLSKLIVYLSKEQSERYIIDQLQSFSWLSGTEYLVEIKKSDIDFKCDIEINPSARNNFFYSNWSIYLKGSEGNFLHSYYLTLMTSLRENDAVCCVEISQFGDEFRAYLLKIIKDREHIKELIFLLNGRQAFFSYEGDGDEYDISFEVLEKCTIDNDFSKLKDCMVYPELNYEWLNIDY